LITESMILQAQVQGSISQDATSPDSVSQLSVSGDLDAGDTTQKGAAVPQNPIGAMFQTDPKLAALSGATDIGSPPVANVTDAVSNAAAANPLTADPSLGLQSLQSRTHLAMANALPVRTSGTERRATASASAPAISTAASSPTWAATTAQPGDREFAREHAAPAPISPVEVDATGSTAPISTASSLGVVGPGVDPSSSGLASIPLSSLADFVADQASSLTSPTSPSAPTPSAPAPQAVKELEISLDPANLGALSVKMRLANGKLSIAIGVSSSSTLAAIESERDAIIARLGSTQHPLENLVITSREPSNESSQDLAQTAPGGNDASDPGNPRQAKSNDSSSGASRGDGGFTRGRNDPSAASGSTEPASGGGSGALLV
jgi:flagellar hook-length control protein FliK